jgi:hypothetical protein
MSWLFSQALVEEYSADICSDGEPSVQLSGSPTQLAYLPPDRMTAFSRPSRFGMTFRPLTADRGEAVLTSYLAAFRARTSALPAREPASTAPAVECGDTWRGSLARFDPVTSSWKTAQRSLLGDSDECSVIWPRSGMTASGQCWELPMSVRRISVTGSGLWPTPIASDSRGSSGRPTPGKQIQLVDAVKWATPVARDYRHPGRSRMERTGSKSGDPLPQQVGGALNPTWVEWLMGWPLGWTDLRPLATDKCLNALPPLGDC